MGVTVRVRVRVGTWKSSDVPGCAAPVPSALGSCSWASCASSAASAADTVERREEDESVLPRLAVRWALAAVSFFGGGRGCG